MPESQLVDNATTSTLKLNSLNQATQTEKLFAEIGSGLDFRRKKFLWVLERINSGDVNQLVVAHPDRLVRFGFELVKWICSTAGCELLVLNQSKLSPEAELIQDMELEHQEMLMVLEILCSEV